MGMGQMAPAGPRQSARPRTPPQVPTPIKGRGEMPPASMAEFDQREKPLSTLKELVGDGDPEIKEFSTKFERIKKLSEFYLSKVLNFLKFLNYNVNILWNDALKLCL